MWISLKNYVILSFRIQRKLFENMWRNSSLNKDELIEALNAIKNGHNIQNYHAELNTIICIIMNTSERKIRDTWNEIKTDNPNIYL